MRIIKLIVFILLITNITKAQDIHFSQYYASPLTLNPALTGKFNGQFRISGIYRDQNFNLYTTPLFRTPSGALDLNLFKEKLKRHNFGVGFCFVNDQQNDRIFNDLRFYVSSAFTFGFNNPAHTQLSIGVQGVYNQQTFDPSRTRLIFSDGIIENFSATAKNFDLNAGIFFNTEISKRTIFYIGGSMMHLLRPSVRFSDFAGSVAITKLPFRFVGHTGAEISIGKNEKWVLIPGLLFQYQGATIEENFGVTLGYHLNNDKDNRTTFFLGCWNRWNRADFESIIPKIGFEFNKVRISGAYDINLGGINRDSKTALQNTPVSSFEVAISFIGIFRPGIKEEVYLFNPRF